ncbi:MAG: ABC transporter ATP-binding protein [Planctomycetota bacterium]
MEVRVEGLSRRFGKTLAVEDLSFTLGEGQIVAFVGPNGAGKTTSMRIMATLDTPDEGTVSYGGVSAVDDPQDARWLFGYMPDALPEHRDIVVYEYLDFFARAFGLRGEGRRRVLSELESFCSLGEMRNKTLSSLSKGMKQRVSLARALVHDPEFLILDEPAAGLDPRARVELRRLLQALARRGKTVFISSHILNELEEMADAAVIIEKGRLVFAGSLHEESVAVGGAASDAGAGGALAVGSGALGAGGVGVGTTDAAECSDGGTDDGAADGNGEAASVAVRRVAVRSLLELGELCERCAETPGVVRVSDEDGHAVLEIAGGEEGVADVLRSLVERGCPVVEFRSSRTKLENLFMDMTRGAVQ